MNMIRLSSSAPINKNINKIKNIAFAAFFSILENFSTIYYSNGAAGVMRRQPWLHWYDMVKL